MKWRRFSMGAPKAGRLDASGIAQPLSDRYRAVAAIHTAIAIIIRFSVSETKPTGTLLLPPTQAHLMSRLSVLPHLNTHHSTIPTVNSKPGIAPHGSACALHSTTRNQ